MFYNLKVKEAISRAVFFAFLVNSFGPIPTAKAEPIYSVEGEFHLPAPGILIHLSPEFNPPILKGIKVHPDNPFRFDFILDQGASPTRGHGFSRVPKQVAEQGSAGGGSDPEEQTNAIELKQQATRLIKYFLASLTIPEKDLWVNLSPYEKDRIIPNSFGLTEMGRDLLAEDYMLKQITASLIYPEGEVGKRFWKRIYTESAERYGTTNIPVNTFNKVWIVPEKAVVYENTQAGAAYVVESKLKVMLEQDYLALEKKQRQPGDMALAVSPQVNPRNALLTTSTLGSQIIREIVIPELTQEVNEGKNFAQLRQVYNSLILATWYKKKIKDSILAQVYEDRNKTAGVQYASTVIPAKGRIDRHSQLLAGIRFNDVEAIYQHYLQAFKKGAYNYIKEELDPATQQSVPRKYFAGGMEISPDKAMVVIESPQYSGDLAQLSLKGLIQVQIDAAMSMQEYKNFSDNPGSLLLHRGLIDKLLETQEEISVLDIGCGPSGQALQSVKKEYGQKVNAVGLDMDIEHGKSTEDIKLIQGDIRRIPLGERSLDIVNEARVLMYFTDTADFPLILKESMRVLKEKGVLILGNSRNLKALDAIFRHLGIPVKIEPHGKFYYVYKEISGQSDAAMKNNQPGKIGTNTGGIDFNADRMNLQLQDAGHAIKFHIDQAQLAQWQNAPGITPVIISIRPMTDLRGFLGLNNQKPSGAV